MENLSKYKILVDIIVKMHLEILHYKLQICIFGI